MATRKSIPAHLLADTALKAAFIPTHASVDNAGQVSLGGFVYKPRAQPEGFRASPQQAACFDWIQNGAGNAILRAVAGAGKTTTLIQALRHMTGDIFFGAYNAKIVKEIEAKAKKANALRPGIYIRTFHSSGLGAFRKSYPNVIVSDKKTYELLDFMIKENPIGLKHLLSFQPFMTKMVSFAKQFLFGIVNDIDNVKPWLELVNHFCMDQELPDGITVEAALVHTIELYKRSHKKCVEVIDFDDMLYAPLAYNCRFWQYSWVLIDEAQDCNLARRELAKRMLKHGGRLLAVGDEKQAIYGFTGAGGDSLLRIEEDFNCAILPLTKTYRCAKSIVNHAHQWVDHIEALDDAPEGIVRQLSPLLDDPKRPWFLVEKPSKDDAIICRYTKPLVACAYGMIREGIACRIEGRDLGLNLIKLATRWKINRIDTLDARLDDYLSNEIRKAQLSGNSKREAEAEDQVATLRIFIERCRAKRSNLIYDLVVDIENLFADNVTDVVPLLTGHKSKGREWPRVYWLEASDRMRPGLAWQAQEELNLKYVITTRAMQELVLVPEPPKELVK